MRNGDRVVQMIPAAGYYAAYQNGDEITYNPVAAWIVVEDQQGRQRVDGIDPSGGNWDGSRAATPRTSWSSYTGTSENAADDTGRRPTRRT